MIFPTIHLNGTSRNELFRQYLAAADAIRAAIAAVENSAPHARDYYVKDQPALTLAQANVEHRERLKKLNSMLEDFQQLAEFVDSAKGNDAIR